MKTDFAKPSKAQAHRSIRNEGKPLFFATSEESAGYNSLRRESRPSKYQMSSYLKSSDGKSHVTLNDSSSSLDASSGEEDEVVEDKGPQQVNQMYRDLDDSSIFKSQVSQKTSTHGVLHRASSLSRTLVDATIESEKLEKAIQENADSEKKKKVCELLCRKVKRLTLYPIRNGIFMDNETFHISRSGQCASAVVMIIVLGVFILKMLSFNQIDTINIFKDTDVTEIPADKQHNIKPTEGLPVTNSTDSEGVYNAAFEEYFPLMFIVKQIDSCEDYKITMTLEPLNTAKYHDPSLVHQEDMTCTTNTHWQAQEYHIGQQFQNIIFNKLLNSTQRG